MKKKDLLLLPNNLREKTPDPRNAKEHYQPFLRKKKKRKSVKQSEIITYQTKTFESPNIGDIKLTITEHPKTSLELSKTIRQVEKVGSNSSLYSDTKKSENVLNEKNVLNKKTGTCFCRFCKYL